MVEFPYQPDMRKGWLYMALYWSIGAALVACPWTGYWQATVDAASLDSRVLLMLATVATSLGFHRHFTNYGRRIDYFGITLFSVLNGWLETYIFFATYDVGRYMFVAPVWFQRFLGVNIFSVYGALVHKYVWGPYMLAQHRKPDEKLEKEGLPFMIGLSLLWIGIYDVQRDVFGIIVSHVLLNFMASARTAMPFTTWDETGAYRDATEARKVS